jgi:hypothetical protein
VTTGLRSQNWARSNLLGPAIRLAFRYAASASTDPALSWMSRRTLLSIEVTGRSTDWSMGLSPLAAARCSSVPDHAETTTIAANRGEIFRYTRATMQRQLHMSHMSRSATRPRLMASGASAPPERPRPSRCTRSKEPSEGASGLRTPAYARRPSSAGKPQAGISCSKAPLMQALFAASSRAT